MGKIGRILFLVVAQLILGSCNFAGWSDEPKSSATSILQFQSSREELTFASLQAGQNIYTGVSLRLAKDGTWRIKSIGPMRPQVAGEPAQAVLDGAGNALLDMNWRPADAAITIRRIHIDARVFGNVSLRLTGDNWYWGNALQAGSDLQDVHELTALTLADYQANPDLTATDAHHTVLHSHSESGTQSFPLQLGAKTYRFCMDRQQEGADSISLSNAAGSEVVRLKAGDACIDIKLDAGLYTMRHIYGGASAARAVFIGPAASSRSAASTARNSSSLQTSAPDNEHPEYWAVYVPANSIHTDGFLSFNGTNDATYGCVGAIDAAAQLHPYLRTGEPKARSLLDSHNFFLITRNGEGAPTAFSEPFTCPPDGKPRFNSYFYNHGPLLVFLRSANFPSNTDLVSAFDILPSSGGKFKLSYTYNDEGSLYVFYALFDSGTVMPPLNAESLRQMVQNLNRSSSSVFGALRFGEFHGDDFQTAFRFFPKGMPEPSKDASGNWTLEQGEVALFSNIGCTGPALLAANTGLSVPQAAGDIGTFNGSLLLGPNTVATLTRNGVSRILNQSGCIDNKADLAQDSLEIGVTTTINIQTNSCEHCNLAGIDLSNQPDALKGVKLQHANLTDAHFNNSDLSRADLRNATLAGAYLSNANLDAANLCQAFLNGRALPNGTSGLAAQLPGAHLKNANLYGAHLDGANFTNASFYSSAHGACPSSCSDTYILPSCASAYQASMNNTDFSLAYLANVDMSNVSANSTKFTGAILFGARFINANLNYGSTSGTAASFAYAFLQGADFTNATIDYVNFDSAYVDTDSGNNCMQIKLRNEITGFPGFTSPSASPPPACVVKGNPTTDITIPSCISTIYAANLGLPKTTSTNTCPDGNSYPAGCTAAAWASPRILAANSSQPNKTCQAKLCNAFTENTCWN